LAEMYVQGVSTRKVKAITEQLCGTTVSSSHVSRATKELDEVLQAWQDRPLGTHLYLYLDARYEKVRQDGQVHPELGEAPSIQFTTLGNSVAMDFSSYFSVFFRGFRGH